MKKHIFALLLALAVLCGTLSGCARVKNAVESGVSSALKEVSSEIESALKEASSEVESALKEASSEVKSGLDEAVSGIKSELSGKEDETAPSGEATKTGGCTMADIKKLKNTGHFAKNTLEHIFDGTINAKGKATGYHYDGVSDSKGRISAGTESKPDEHGNGFSSFYPDSWTPQQVVDAINEAYDYATSSKGIRDGDLWIGYAGDLEINMYLDSSKRITTAYPIYEGE